MHIYVAIYVFLSLSILLPSIYIYSYLVPLKLHLFFVITQVLSVCLFNWLCIYVHLFTILSFNDGYFNFLPAHFLTRYIPRPTCCGLVDNYRAKADGEAHGSGNTVALKPCRCQGEQDGMLQVLQGLEQVNKGSKGPDEVQRKISKTLVENC